MLLHRIVQYCVLETYHNLFIHYAIDGHSGGLVFFLTDFSDYRDHHGELQALESHWGCKLQASLPSLLRPPLTNIHPFGLLLCDPASLQSPSLGTGVCSSLQSQLRRPLSTSAKPLRRT